MINLDPEYTPCVNCFIMGMVAEDPQNKGLLKCGFCGSSYSPNAYSMILRSWACNQALARRQTAKAIEIWNHEDSVYSQA